MARRIAALLTMLLAAAAASAALAAPASAVTPVHADLALAAAAAAPSVTVDDVVDFTFAVTNRGPDGDPAVVLTDVLPYGLDIVRADTTQGTCTAAQTVVCALGAIGPGASASVTVRAEALEAGVRTTTASVAGTGDDAPGDNAASASVTVVDHQADLGITNTASTSTAAIGDEIAYTLRVVNDGPYWQGDVGVSDWLPTRLTLVSATTTRGTCADRTTTRGVGCDLGRIDPGGGATVTVVARANASGTVTNTASVAGDSLGVDDPNEANDAAGATVAVARPAAAPVPPPAPKPIVLPAPFPAVPAAPHVNQPLPVATRVTLRHRGRRLSGRVTSVDACVGRRSVVLRRDGKGTRSYGRATTRADGSYAIATRKALRGRLYVAVAAKTVGSYRCRTARSPLG